MLANKFKTVDCLDLEKSMQKYIFQFYDQDAYPQIAGFVKEFAQHRNVIGNIVDSDVGLERLNQNRTAVTDYIRMMDALKTKIAFGKDELSLQLRFGWRDVLTNSYYYSENFSLEYYSSFFNLGVTFSQIGRLYLNVDDEAKIKTAIKNFQYAAWTFDKIKAELPAKLPPKETPPDLSQNYLSYCSFLCLAQAQSLLYNVAVSKALDCELRAQLAKGAQDLFNSALQLATDSLGRYINDTVKLYLSNRKYFYGALTCLSMKEKWEQTFDQTGEGWGSQIIYMTLANNCLKVGMDNLSEIKAYINIYDYENLKGEIEYKLEQMIEKNNRVIHESVPEIDKLPKVQKLIKATPVMYPEENHTIPVIKQLENLVPREVRPMLMNYKEEMMKYISSNLDNYENDIKIESFLNEQNLPHSLESAISCSEISQSLWSRIQEVQEKGGYMFLENLVNSIESESNEISSRISQLELDLYKEEEEDTQFRSLYGIKWVRQPSAKLNANYKAKLQDYQGKLALAAKCDMTIKESLVKSFSHFETLALPKNILEKKIPKKTENAMLKTCTEASDLRALLDELHSLKKDLMGIINKIFMLLNDDTVIPLFISVLQGKTTEKAILSDSKPKYEKLFEVLKGITEYITATKEKIVIKNQQFIRAKSAFSTTMDENETFFKELDAYVQLYHQKLREIENGKKFYLEFTQRLNKLDGDIKDFIFARDIEKNEMADALSRGEKLQLASSKATSLPSNVYDQQSSMRNYYADTSGQSDSTSTNK